jgi:hypothetical protein
VDTAFVFTGEGVDLIDGVPPAGEMVSRGWSLRLGAP